MSARARTKRDLEYELERLRAVAQSVVSAYLAAEEFIADAKVGVDARWPGGYGRATALIPSLARAIGHDTEGWK